MWIEVHNNGARLSRYTYKCVVLPDHSPAPARLIVSPSQCTYRCVVLPDLLKALTDFYYSRLNAPTGAWCSLTR